VTLRTLRMTAISAALSIVLAAPGAAQTSQTFHACYVPDVGALYVIKLNGLPDSCVSDSHVEITWTEGGGEVADGSITTAKLADGAVTADKLADGAVTATALASASVTAAKLADQAVTTDKLANGAVTAAKLANSAVTAAKLADQAVTTAKLVDRAVTTAKLADGAVTSIKLPNGAVTGRTLADIQEIRSAETNVASNTLGLVTVQCPSGTRVITGGNTTSSSLVTVTRSFRASTTSWTIGVRNTSSQTQTFRAIAYCI
jgi:hypothetical protein